MDSSDNRYLLSDNTYRQITDLIYSFSGIRFDQSYKFMILQTAQRHVWMSCSSILLRSIIFTCDITPIAKQKWM